MDGGETSPGWKWDANIRTWIEVRHDLDEAETLIWVLVWRWDVNVGPWIELRCNLDWGEMQIYGPWWRRFMDEGETRILWPEFRWAGPGWKFDAHIETWMGFRWCRCGSEMQLGRTGMEVKHHLGKYMDLDWGKTRFGWDWDRTRMELMCNSRDLDGGDMRPGMRWDTKFSTWYELGRDMDGGEIRIQWPGYRWYSTYAHFETWMVDRVIWD